MRQIAGWVMLVSACILMLAWVRSRSSGDSLHFPGFSGTSNAIVSVDRSILWVTSVPGFHDGLFIPKWEQHDFDPHSGSYHIFDVVNVKWERRYIGFGAGRTQPSNNSHGRGFSFWIVPYWSLVFPLLLLSAVLLSPRSKSKSETDMTSAPA